MCRSTANLNPLRLKKDASGFLNLLDKDNHLQGYLEWDSQSGQWVCGCLWTGVGLLVVTDVAMYDIDHPPSQPDTDPTRMPYYPAMVLNTSMHEGVDKTGLDLIHRRLRISD